MKSIEFHWKVMKSIEWNALKVMKSIESYEIHWNQLQFINSKEICYQGMQLRLTFSEFLHTGAEMLCKGNKHQLFHYSVWFNETASADHLFWIIPVYKGIIFIGSSLVWIIPSPSPFTYDHVYQGCTYRGGVGGCHTPPIIENDPVSWNFLI